MADDLDKIKLNFIATRKATAEMTAAIDADIKKTAFDTSPDLSTLLHAYDLDKTLIVEEANSYLNSAAAVLKKHGVKHPETLSENDYSAETFRTAVAEQKKLISGVARNNVNLQLYGTGEGSESEKSEKILLHDYAVQELDKVTPPLATPPKPQQASPTQPVRTT